MKLFVIVAAACLAGLVLAGCASNGAGPTSSTVSGSLAADPPQNGVMVYYMHRTFRCPTCLKIERMSHKAVQDAFAAELSSGRVQWRTLNYQEHENLARRYEVTAPSVVLVLYRDGAETSHQVLDRTWSLYSQPAEFQAYVVGAVRDCLDAVK